MQILFKVKHQTILRLDAEKLASGSRNYVEAVFNFSEEWEGLIKTAVFTKNGFAFHVLLEEDKCMVPAEVLETKGVFKVSVFGGDLITVTNAEIHVAASGYAEGGSPADPTPDIYQQIIKMIEEIEREEIPEEKLEKAIEDYFKVHPVPGGGITREECEAIVQAIINDNDLTSTNTTLSAKKITDLCADTLSQVDGKVESYVNAHKEELKGDKGDKGDKGNDGTNGKDGSDYVITEADYDAIADVVIEKLPQAESEEY